MAVLVAAKDESGSIWRIVSGSMGSHLEPPGSPLFDWEIVGGSDRNRNPHTMMALPGALDDAATWVPERIRDQARRLLAEATYVRSDLWERNLYGYFRGCYSPDGTERGADRLLIVGQEEPLYPEHPLVVSGERKLSEYSSLNRGPKVLPDDPRLKPEHHAAYLYVRKFFPDAEPRLDLIESGGDYGTRPCRKCERRVQYEARFDAYAVFGEASAACIDGEPHDPIRPQEKR